MRLDRFVIPKDVPFKRRKPNIIVCEGYGDACFFSAILHENKIDDYDVGCPSKEVGGAPGKDRIPQYLDAIASDRAGLQRILVVADSDESQINAFNKMAKALGKEFDRPTAPYVSAGTSPKVAVYLMPEPDAQGCLDHLLWKVARKNRRCQFGVEAFAWLTGNEKNWNYNDRAKMRVHSAIAAYCEDDPASSVVKVWREKGNPFPLDSAVFKHLTDYMRDFLI